MINVNSVFSIIQAYIRVIVLNSNENNSRGLSLLLKPVIHSKCKHVLAFVSIEIHNGEQKLDLVLVDL